MRSVINLNDKRMSQHIKSAQTKHYPDFGEKINENRLFQLQQIARNRVIEPFEGRKSLETVQKTRNKIEKGILQVKRFLNKTGDWVADSEVAKISKSKASNMVEDFKDSSSQRKLSQVFSRLAGKTASVRQATQSTYSNLEDRTRRFTVSYIRKGLELLMLEDDEKWILDRTNQIFKTTSYSELAQIQALNAEQRSILIEKIYPYDSQKFQIFAKKFDLTFNFGLGVVVATNIPGTGILVSLVNMAKTLIKLGNRLKIMSAIYGYHLKNSHTLFKVSAIILKSLSNWENNDQHLPLEPEVLAELYTDKDVANENAFQEMIDAIVRKEAYIAIPGVGSISLGKITLDDIKMDLVVKHLVRDYFAKKNLEQQMDTQHVEKIISDFMKIYHEFNHQEYFKKARKIKESAHLRLSRKKWKEKAKMLAGFDLVLDESSIELDQYALEIFHKIRLLNDDKKNGVIKDAVGTIISSF